MKGKSRRGQERRREEGRGWWWWWGEEMMGGELDLSRNVLKVRVKMMDMGK